METPKTADTRKQTADAGDQTADGGLIGETFDRSTPRWDQSETRKAE